MTMIINHVNIHNYKSIKELTIPFKNIDNRFCNIILGKNESGKSNILKALSLLDSNSSIDYSSDCNKDSKKNGDTILVEYNLSFDKKYWEQYIFDTLQIESSWIDITSINRRVEIDAENNRKDYYWIYLDDRVSPQDMVIDTNNKVKPMSEVYNGSEKITKDNIATLIPQHRILTKSIIENVIEKTFFDIFEKEIPQVIFWEPSSEYLINGAVDLTQFKNKLSLSLPLKNIFHIAGINEDNIPTRINLITKDTEEREELAQVLSEEITEYVNTVWAEHKININVKIESNLQCSVSVEDKDNNRPKYKMEQRSDGFKQFISILLNLSAENQANILKNKLILLDEPEVHLHPSGVKYLKDELLKISVNNHLVIATHSTYMVDSLNLHRHFSVTKQKSITSLNQILENNPYEEEVIYESLGTSIFEFVTPCMLIFEGKTDKDIFDIFRNKFNRELGLKNISAISANCAQAICKYVKFFNNGLVKGFVVVDSDNEGRKVKKDILKENSNYTEDNTFEINDLISGTKTNKTLEDLLPKEIIEKVLLEIFDLELELDDNNSYIEQIKKAKKDINEKELKINIVKYVAIDIDKKKLSKEKIKEHYPRYYEFFSKLNENIKS